jgi:glycosyltransferase involved in cell wall biosynthesis
MPTYNRRRYIPAAIRCFQAQTYPNKELAVLDNGTDIIADLVPCDGRIRYYRIDGPRYTTGAMRNACAERAQGTILAHWDDDDWSHPMRLMEQHRYMLSMSVSMVGYNEMYFIAEEQRKAWLYRNPELYAMGTSLMYTREYWKAHRFPDLAVAEDTAFIYNAQHRRAMSTKAAGDRMIARIHAGNTCNKDYLCEPMWMAAPYALVAAMLPEGDCVCETTLVS